MYDGIRTRRPGSPDQASTQARGEAASEKNARPRTLPPLATRNSGPRTSKKMTQQHDWTERRAKASIRSRQGGQARGSHTRNSPAFRRQTRCEKERPGRLRHLYTVLPHPREEGGARTRHHFPSLHRATSSRHSFNHRPSPLPPTSSRGPWAMCAEPTDPYPAPCACSSRPRG
jgi:hypothetical protein